MNDKKKGLKKSDIFYHIVKGWRLIVIFTLVGLVAGVAIIGFGYVRGEMTREYRITSSVAVIAVNSNGRYSENNREPLKSDIDFARGFTDSAIYIIKSQRNLQAVVDQVSLQGVSVNDISRNLTVSRYGDTEIIELTLLWRTEKEGLEIMNAITSVSHSTMIATEKIGGVAVINEPRSTFIVGGNISLSTWIYSAIFGLVAGVVFCILRFLLGATVVNEIDLEEIFSLDSLGSIPLNVNYARAKPLSEESQVIEDEIKSVTHLLINRLELAGANKLYITSTQHGEGKSRLIADIALQFAFLGKKTLLIDCDFKNPMLGTLFSQDLTYIQSLNSLYRGDSDKIDAIVPINGCLDLLPTVLEENPAALNDAMLGQLAAVMDGYDYVMIDTAPVGVDAEVLRLNEIVDTAVYVVKCDDTKVEDIKNALFRIAKSGIPVAGGVFNCVVNWKQTILNTPRRLAASLKREAKRRAAAKEKEKKRAQRRGQIEEKNTATAAVTPETEKKTESQETAEAENVTKVETTSKEKSVETTAVKEPVKQEPKPTRAELRAQKKAEKEAKKQAEKEAKLQAKLKAEQEAKEKAEKAAKEKAEKEAKEKAEKEAKEKAEKEAKEKAEKEAKEKAKKEAQAKAKKNTGKNGKKDNKSKKGKKKK